MAKSNRLRLYFWVFLALNIGFIAWSRTYLKPLTTRDIVKFEVAKNLPAAEQIMNEWKQTGKFEKAQQSVQADYVFIVLYAAGFITCILLLSRLSRHELLRKTGRFITVLVPIAAICDVIENIAMTRTLSGAASNFYVALAYDMAVAKFSIIILTLIFLLICLLFWIGSRFAPKYEALSPQN